MVVVSEDLFFNVVKDWEKRDVSSDDKAKFLNSYLSEFKISQRELARRLGIPFSTLHDWLSGRQKEKYYALKEKNEFFRDLSNVSVISNDKHGFYFKGVENNRSELDSLLDRLLFVLSKKDFVVSDKTRRLLKELRVELEKVKV